MQLMIEGTSAAGRQDVQRIVTPGQTVARVNITWEASPAPRRASIVTPAGTFSDIVGVHIEVVAARGLNFNATAEAQVSKLVKGFTLLGGDEDLYYARGWNRRSRVGALPVPRFSSS
jgi:hypothetical protein